MTLGQGYDTPSGHKKSLCEGSTSNVHPQERYRPDTNFSHTDGQRDSSIYPQTLFAGDLINVHQLILKNKICRGFY